MDRKKKISDDKETIARDRRSERPQNLRRMSAARLRHDSINFNVPANEGAREYVKDAHGEDSWRNKVLHFLHSQRVQYTLMFLLFLDVIILFIEIFLVGQFPPCNVVERDCLACCPSSSDAARFLSGGDEEGICETGFSTETTGYGSCDDNKYHTVHVVEKVLFGFTISILLTFTVEVNAEMLALGPIVFFRQIFYLFDYVIIVVSTTMELVFFFLNDELALSGASGFIIFVRIWRFIRIGHGIVEVTTEYTHGSYEDLLTYAETLEADLKKRNLPLPAPPKSLHREESHGEPEQDDAKTSSQVEST